MNYTPLHVHTMLSNGVTNVDSVTSYKDYVDAAKSFGMTAIAFTEHGSVFEWLHKKEAVEAAGMKYIHGIEAYVTENIDPENKIRDNYHVILLAKNYDGFLEINRLASRAFNKTDGHFYYTPRISYEELTNTSQNVLITTACLGGILSKGNEDLKKRFTEFIKRNKERCFLEVQPHLAAEQAEYNRELYELSNQYGIKLVATNDTHSLNERHAKGRMILQKAKNVSFPDEESWDMTFKSYDNICFEFKKQKALPEDVYLKAIENTNYIASLVEPFEIDRNPKYPKIYEDPERVFWEKIETKANNHSYLTSRYEKNELMERLRSEFDVYKKVGAIDFMLLQTYLREWEHENDIWCGPGRGSVSGSLVAYTLGITQMDSLKFNLNFFRFMNPHRVSLADIDTDYGGTDRDKVKLFLLRDRMNLEHIRSAEIITFNTIALKGAVRDVGRAMEMPLAEVDAISKACDNEKEVEKLRSKHKELFEYVDIVQGTIVSIGTHPSGVLVADFDIEGMVGLCMTKESEYPVSMLNMKELDSIMAVKLDILGLDNVALINETCKLAGIERVTPDNTNLNDMDVWKSIRDDTTMVFQWESDSAQAYLRKFMSDETLLHVQAIVKDFSMLKWFSFGNGLIRPACSSYRNEVADGIFYDNGFDALNDFLGPEMGHICMQETIMQFLVKFCGYTEAESDSVRRAIAKKKGTETLLPEIEERFIAYCPLHYNITADKCSNVIKPFLQIILDASDYGFSWNHSDAYSCIGYLCGYLRHYYPMEFITAALNIFKDKEDKTKAIAEYAQSKNVKIRPIRYGHSGPDYTLDKENKVIYKGIQSVKYMNKAIAEELMELSKKEIKTFSALLYEIFTNTSVNSRQLDILIALDFFSEYGNIRELNAIRETFEKFYNDQKKQMKTQIKKDAITDRTILQVIEKYSTDKNKDGKVLKSYTFLDLSAILSELETIILDLKLDDLSYKLKMKHQEEYLGYIDLTTGKESDRRKLMLTDVHPLKSKDNGNIWGYALFTRSVGSGKSSRLTLRAKSFDKEPVHKGDIIYARSVRKNESGFWYLIDYEVILE